MKVFSKRAATLLLSLAVLLAFTPFVGEWTGGAIGAQKVYADVNYNHYEVYEGGLYTDDNFILLGNQGIRLTGDAIFDLSDNGQQFIPFIELSEGVTLTIRGHESDSLLITGGIDMFDNNTLKIEGGEVIVEQPYLGDDATMVSYSSCILDSQHNSTLIMSGGVLRANCTVSEQDWTGSAIQIENLNVTGGEISTTAEYNVEVVDKNNCMNIGGQFDMSAGVIQADAIGSESIGIYGNNGNITGGTVTATGTKYGMKCPGLMIGGDASVNGNGDTAGICVTGNTTIQGSAEVTGMTSSNNNSAAGILVDEDGTLTTAGSAEVSAVGKVLGVYAKGPVTVKDDSYFTVRGSEDYTGSEGFYGEDTGCNLVVTGSGKLDVEAMYRGIDIRDSIMTIKENGEVSATATTPTQQSGLYQSHRPAVIYVKEFYISDEAFVGADQKGDGNGIDGKIVSINGGNGEISVGSSGYSVMTNASQYDDLNLVSIAENVVLCAEEGGPLDWEVQASNDGGQYSTIYDKESGEQVRSFSFFVLPSMEKMLITLSNTAYTYDGTAKKPGITVYDEERDTTLTNGVDYTVSYKNNKNAGTATVTVKGQGEYFGMASKTFTIKPRAIKNAKATLGTSTYTYDGKFKKPTVTCKDTLSGKTVTLKSGTDYTVSYKNNKAVGKATVTIKGKGNYTGTITKNFTIKPKKAVISKAIPGTKQIKVTMSAKPGAIGASTYEIKYRIKGSSKWKTTTTTSKTKTIKSLKKGKQYQIKVQAYKKINGKKYAGAWSKIKTTSKVK